jgi:hypothetical protein
MKTIKKVTPVIFAILLLSFAACEKEPAVKHGEDSILPEKMSVDIPNALSNENLMLKSTAVDTLQGNEIYEHLTFFIRVGEAGAEIVEDIIYTISYYNINKAMVLTYESDEDGRAKKIEVVEKATFEGINYDYKLTLTDEESVGNADGGKGLQIFWNTNQGAGVEGVAILKPYNINRKDREMGEAIFRIDYSDINLVGYDARMIVQIANLPVASALEDPYSMRTLKMFVGKVGDKVDIYGNSNHPNAKFFNDDTGFNWAFVAAGDDQLDIGVAEVGLPPSTLDATTRKILLEDYSIQNVFSDQIYDIWPNISEDIVNTYLYNTAAPGYFASRGFVQGGTSPGSEYDDLDSRIEVLSPYNPKVISTLTINFQ